MTSWESPTVSNWHSTACTTVCWKMRLSQRLLQPLHPETVRLRKCPPLFFRLQHFDAAIAVKSGDGEPLFFVRNDNNFAVKLGALSLRGINRHDGAVMDQRTHGVSLNPKADGISRIGTPLRGGAYHIYGVNLI